MIRTVDSNWRNHQQRNVVKGIAMPYIVKEILNSNNVSLVHNEDTIKKCIEVIKNHKVVGDFIIFKIKKRIKINGRELKRNDYISPSALGPENIVDIFDKVTKYGKEAKECSYCGNKISKDYLVTSKCKKCRKGYFRSYIDRRLGISNKDNLIKWLIQEDYIGEITWGSILHRKRLDGWFFVGKQLYIFETKNKEFTELKIPEIFQTLNYIRIINHSELDILEKAYLIYNGSNALSKKFIKRLVSFDKNILGILNIISFNEWINQNEYNIPFNFVPCERKNGKYVFSFQNLPGIDKAQILIYKINNKENGGKIA